MTKQTPKTLEPRIANALTDPHIAAADLYELVRETEVALTAAEATAEAERQKAVDAVMPDAAEAERSAWAAEVHRDRLQSLLSRLRQRLAEVSAAKRSADREADFEAVKSKRDALAREFCEFYPDLVSRFIDFAHRTAAVDDECARFNDAALAGEHRRLLGVELTARKLESFDRSDPSIIETVKLPHWTESGRMAWPLPKTPLAVAVAQAMAPPADARFGANWAAAREQDMARRAATEARWAKQEEARQAESRRAYEASLRR
jgi:hypothetical protein